MANRRVIWIGENPKLEGRVIEPTGRLSRGCVVLTHPHSKLGGDLRNNVVQSLSLHLAQEGFTVLSFNFRGVGQSEGSSTWTGKSELEDVLQAATFARSLHEKVFLIGYSFGSAVGCACNDAFDGYVAVSYPYGWTAGCALGAHYSKADCEKPKLFVVGERDQFASVSSLQGFVGKLQDPKDFRVVPGVDHFWFDREYLLHQPILEFLQANL